VHIALLCATQRGLRVFEALSRLAPDDRITVFSFQEEAGEPRFFDELRNASVSHGSQFIEARNVNAEHCHDFWRDERIDLLLAVSWRYIVPNEVFRRPTLGSYVFHDSLLPAYRGFSPTVWAIAAGADHTGVTLFEMAEEVDTGDIVDQIRVPIGAQETIRDVLERTTQGYLDVLSNNLLALRTGTAELRPQDHSQATYCRKRTVEDNLVSWDRGSKELFDLIRAVTVPYSGAYGSIAGQRLKIWAADVVKGRLSAKLREPGGILAVHPGIGLEVATGDGALLVTNVEAPEGGPFTADRLLGRDDTPQVE
jgi:methionyl-tRNA formyltransferase